MFGLFGGGHAKQDKVVAEMLLVTFASYKKTFEAMGRDFLISTIKRYPGINIMSEQLPETFTFVYPNELSPFVIGGSFVREPGAFTAVGGPPYDGFSLTIGLKEDGVFLTSAGDKRGRSTPRGKYLANWFVKKGAGLIP